MRGLGRSFGVIVLSYMPVVVGRHRKRARGIDGSCMLPVSAVSAVFICLLIEYESRKLNIATLFQKDVSYYSLARGSRQLAFSATGVNTTRA